MRRWSRTVACVGMAMCVIGASASPGLAAEPRPLGAQWWFGIWDVQKSLWPHGKGRDVTVAVIDTGVQATIPELSGAVVPGTDFETGSGDARTDNNPSFGSPGHGTRMATLIASRGTGTGFAGVAPESKILPIVGQSSAAFTKGIRYAADHGAKVISLSQASPGACPADMQEAVSYAIRKNIVIVAGAGNDGDSSNASNHPANCAGVLAVGAADIDTKPWVKTQRQPYVKVAGPGVLASGVGPDGRFNPNKAGTSQAAALTSGIVAIIRSAHPDWSNREVTRQLVASAKDIGPKGKDSLTGYGFTRPYRIFEGMIPKNTPNPVFQEYDQWASTHKEEAEPTASPPPLGGSTDVPTIAFFGGVGVLMLGGIVFAIFMARKARRPVGAGPVGPVPGAPPTFGASPYGPPGPGQTGPQPMQPGMGQQPQPAPGGPPPQAQMPPRPGPQPPYPTQQQPGYPPQGSGDYPQ